MISKARLAGIIYLIHGMTGMFTLLYLPSQLFVAGDAMKTIEAISESTSLLRWGIALGLISQVIFIAVPLLLSEFLERYSRVSAKLMTFFVITSVSIFFVATSNLFIVLDMVASGHSLDVEQAADILTLIDRYQTGLELTSLFWGLWLLPLGYLILKSGVIPKVLGGLLVLGGLGYIANLFGPLLAPTLYADDSLFMIAAIPSTLGECGTMLWLIIVGARSHREIAGELSTADI